MNKINSGSISMRLIIAAGVLLLAIWGVFAFGGLSDDGGSGTGANETVAATLEALPYVDDQEGVELSNEELADMVAPAVVCIVTEWVSQGWFRQPVPVTGAGTGVVVSPDGYIVTNSHVVEGAVQVTVTLSDGRTFEASGVATDASHDLAVVRIDATGLPYLSFLEDSMEQLNVLDEVVAVGNALGLSGGPTWTTGVVSNLGRSIDMGDGVVLEDVIQTDAAINSGNSGGPLLNRAGQVVGINVAIASNAENIGFAISSNVAVPAIADLVQELSVSYA